MMKMFKKTGMMEVNVMMRRLCFALFLVGSSLLYGCVSSSSSNGGISNVAPVAESADSGEDISGYRLRPMDPIYIRFSGILDQQDLSLVVDANGEIRLLHLDEPVKAVGLTATELAREIEKRYLAAGIYKHLSVSVTMTAKMYYVQGEVNAPGQFQLLSGTTLMQAIASARGYTSFANKKKVTITRHGKVYTYDVRKLEADPELDPKIKAGDMIKVWQTWY